MAPGFFTPARVPVQYLSKLPAGEILGTGNKGPDAGDRLLFIIFIAGVRETLSSNRVRPDAIYILRGPRAGIEIVAERREFNLCGMPRIESVRKRTNSKSGPRAAIGNN